MLCQKVILRCLLMMKVNRFTVFRITRLVSCNRHLFKFIANNCKMQSPTFEFELDLLARLTCIFSLTTTDRFYYPSYSIGPNRCYDICIIPNYSIRQRYLGYVHSHMGQQRYRRVCTRRIRSGVALRQRRSSTRPVFLLRSWSTYNNFPMDAFGRILAKSKSSRYFQELVTIGVITTAICDESDLGWADNSSDVSRNSIDSEIGLADYWTCVQCNTRNNNPLFRYCEKCYQVWRI